MEIMMIEGSKAGVVALAGVVAFHSLANKFWPRYKAFPMSPRLFWLSSFVAGAFWVRAEQGHIEHQDRERAAMADARDALDEQYRQRRH
jgi:hypothetical protein